MLFDHPNAADEPLLHGPDVTLTAGVARARAQAVAGGLRAAGVEPGHAVAVQLPNGPGAITAMFGVWLAGAVFVPVNPRSPERERQGVLEATRAAALLAGDAPRTLSDPAVYDTGVAFVTWTSGTTGTPKPVLHTHANYLELLDRVLAPLRGDARR